MSASQSYGQTVIPGDSVTVRPGTTVSVSTAFNATAGIVGNMDVENGTASTGEVVNPTSLTQADEMFGEGSELATLVRHAYLNGAADVQAVAVPETSTTETFGDGTEGTSSGTLSNAPVDPTVVPEHSIVATDGSGTEYDVSTVYQAPSQPEEGVVVDATTGEWSGATSGQYDFEYDYPSFTDAVEQMSSRNVRNVGVATEREGVANDTLTAVKLRASRFDFRRAFVGTDPDISSTDYEDALSSQRLSLIGTPRGYTEEGQSGEYRTVGAVVGKEAGKDLGDSTTYEALNGFTGLRNDFSPTELATFIDENQLYMLMEQQSAIKVVKDMTTSSDPRFERVFQCEIIDEGAYLSHQVAQAYIGELNTPEQREGFGRSLRSTLYGLTVDSPPLLDDYAVNVIESADDTVDVEIGFDPVDVIDTINVTINVGDIVSYGGTDEGAA